MIGQQTISTLGNTLSRDLKQELRDQGHYLTGALERSIDPEVKEGTSTVLEVEALDYIDDLETGIPSNHIDETDPAYIQGLTEYAQKRFHLSGKAAVKAAIAIARKHAKEGMPTKNSYQYSKNGQRTRAIADTYSDNEKIYDQQIETGLSHELDEFIDKTFDITIF